MNRWFGSVAALGLLASCASIQAPGPERHPATPRVWEVPPSTLTVPLKVGAAQARQWAETVVPQTIEGKGSGQRTLSAWFLKHDWHYWWTYRLVRSPLALGFDANRVRVAATLTGTLDARWDTLPGDISSDVEADAGVEATLSVAPDWTLAADTKTYFEVRRADVPIGIAWDGNFFGETISIAGPVQEALKPSLTTLDGQLRQWVAAVAVKPAAESLWRALEEPRSLGPGLWFTLGAEQAALGPMTASADGLSVDLVLTARPALAVGSRPEAVHRPLPPAAAAGAGEAALVLNLPVAVEWSEAMALTMTALGKPAEVPLGAGGALRVLSLEASTDGDRALIRVTAQVTPPWPGPAVDAVVWLGALPEWDPAARRLKLTHLSLDVRTRDYLAQAASWLAAGTWVKALERNLVWDLGPRLDGLRDQASVGLKAVVLGPHVILSGSVDTLEVVDLTLSDRGPVVLARVTGAATVRWEP